MMITNAQGVDSQQADEVDGLKIPVLVSPHLKPLVEGLQGVYSELNRAAGPVNITFSIPRGQSLLERPNDRDCQEGHDSHPIFVHSPDFRMVSL
jgi:hypothetical protein